MRIYVVHFFFLQEIGNEETRLRQMRANLVASHRYIPHGIWIRYIRLPRTHIRFHTQRCSKIHKHISSILGVENERPTIGKLNKIISITRKIENLVQKQDSK